MSGDDLFPTRRSLLSRLKDWNDDTSWREFFDTYWRLIYKTSLRAGLSEGEAEDVVQETVVSIARKMHAFKYDPATCSFRTWLLTLTKRRIADQFRKRPPEVALPAASPGPETVTDPAAQVVDPCSFELDAKWDADWEANLLRAALDRVKRRVSGEQYQIYDYHVVQGRSVAQVCKALGVSATQVYLAKHRVGKFLKQEVEYLCSKFL